jgi:hypothetical protein
MSREIYSGRYSKEDEITVEYDSKVIASSVLSECGSKAQTPMGRPGPLVAKIPVVLADFELQVNIESEVTLESVAREIKTIDKKVFLTECKLIPFTNKLFIEGYVRKSIQYSTGRYYDAASVGCDIKHTVYEIPFKGVTEITFSRQPVYGKDFKKKLAVLHEDKLNENKKEESWVHVSKPYEAIYCELVSAKIMETNQCKDVYRYAEENTCRGDFIKLVGQMVLNITLRVLQQQYICIPEPEGDVIMMDECSSVSDDGSACNLGDKYYDIEVGYDPEKGLIGKRI